ncbi:alkyl hydroperoxide reductase AhpD [Streptomyces capoamus]|uniref:Alkyl hydroperoxide reductase AhpD n=1 Tax=Streptomyces capoamus TaxID=68183 RepID=A0A919F318_9ACTN|nr:carboxymuconolactone decarboxylase family protein [Streptomyces capoamus]GGW13431.1 alkyl hydroperoxide reductase AhpD [Streptomyces libani subsp. rufus]GHG75054.1 alkyl hydroperoxide reductase AhpD [Streptomyces capoamus]
METRMNLFDTELGTKVGKRIYAVSQVIQESPLPKSTQELVQLRASQINGCGFCVDIHSKDAAAAGEDAARLSLVAAWRHSTVFTDAERAALALTEEGTRIIDGYAGVTDETWAGVRKHYDEEQAVALVSLVAMINATNRLGVILNNQGGSYVPGNLTTLAG